MTVVHTTPFGKINDRKIVYFFFFKIIYVIPFVKNNLCNFFVNVNKWPEIYVIPFVNVNKWPEIYVIPFVKIIYVIPFVM